MDLLIEYGVDDCAGVHLKLLHSHLRPAVAVVLARAVALVNGYCARCHTAGFPAGVPYSQEAGSGGFGPALWDGRPVVQFGEAPQDPEETDLLIDFLINGSEAQEPYGLNGFGSGRMPAFGAILDQGDIDLLARYLRSGDLTGMGGE